MSLPNVVMSAKVPDPVFLCTLNPLSSNELSVQVKLTCVGEKRVAVSAVGAVGAASLSSFSHPHKSNPALSIKSKFFIFEIMRI